MRVFKSLVAGLWVGVACSALLAAEAMAQVESESPAACSQVGYTPVHIPDGVDPSTVSPNPDGPTLVGIAFYVTGASRNRRRSK